MSELGELLELLHGARLRFRTARGVLRSRHNWRLTQEAMLRENARGRRGRGGGSMQILSFATSDGPAEEPPDVRQEVTRFWFAPPGRMREEMESPPYSSHTTVIDGERWWTYSPQGGATSNVGLSEEEAAHVGVGGGEQFRSLLDPSDLAGVLDFDRIDADGDRLVVQARPRDDLEDYRRHMIHHVRLGADALELVVDCERGVVLRLATSLDGQELSVAEFEELVFDEVFPDETFVFVPPPGEEIGSPWGASQRRYSLEEAAALAGFRVFEVPELPDGSWRVHVHFSPARERPPMPANVALFYSRSDGRGSIIVSQHASGAGGFGWSGIHPDGPVLEEIERDGVSYTAMRTEPEQGSGSAVTFEREGTAIQLQSQELDVEALVDLAASLRQVA